MIEPTNIINFLKIVLFMMGIALIFRYLFHPLYLINDKNREAEEKKLTHIMNLDNMS